jgi:hypothetical protein
LFWSVAIQSLITTLIMLLQKGEGHETDEEEEDDDNDEEGAGKGEST